MSSKIEKNLADTQRLSDELKWRLTFEKSDLTDRFENLDDSYLELQSKLEEVGGMTRDLVEERKGFF